MSHFNELWEHQVRKNKLYHKVKYQLDRKCLWYSPYRDLYFFNNNNILLSTFANVETHLDGNFIIYSTNDLQTNINYIIASVMQDYESWENCVFHLAEIELAWVLICLKNLISAECLKINWRWAAKRMSQHNFSKIYLAS